MIALAGDLPDVLQHGHDQQAPAPADAPVELEDTSDDSLLLLALSQAGLLPIMFTLQSDQVLDAAWSPTAPVHPPTSSTSSDLAAAE